MGQKETPENKPVKSNFDHRGTNVPTQASVPPMPVNNSKPNSNSQKETKHG